MSTTTASRSVVPAAKNKPANFAAKVLGSAAILAVAITFIIRYVFRY